MADKKNIVLIVEDEVYLRQLLKEKLNGRGFYVLEADDGMIGLKTALSEHPDVILLDIIMPVMDGMTMLKELRKDEWGKNAVVIILSNLSEPETISEGVEESAYGYLVKSNWDPDDIVALVRGASKNRSKKI